MELKFYLNGTQVTWNVEPDQYLAHVLREHGVLSIHIGCNESACGACTVLVDDKPVLSCSLLAVKVQGKHLTTVEGIQDEAERLSHFFDCKISKQTRSCFVHAFYKSWNWPVYVKWTRKYQTWGSKCL